MTAPIGRKPTTDDFDAFKAAVYDHQAEIDPTEEYDWNDVALGFLLARGVDHGFTGWELLSSYTCGDRERMLDALVDIDAMTEPDRHGDEADDEETDDAHA